MESSQGGPGISPLDYSEAAARKAALSNSLQHPLTLWPTAIGIIGAGGAVILGTIPIAAIIGIGGFGIGVTNWFVNYFVKSDSNMRDYYAELRNCFEKEKKTRLARLESDLKERDCDQGVAQIKQFNDGLETLEEVLGRVMSPGELTFSRFMAVTEEIYRSGIENLEKIYNLLTSVKDLDQADLVKKIKVLKKLGDEISNSDKKSLVAYEVRLRGLNERLSEVKELLAENEQALTAISEAGSAALRIGDKGKEMTSKEKLEEAMELMGNMISRAKSKPQNISLEENNS